MAVTGNVHLDIYENDSSHTVRTYLPGVKAEDVDIDMDNNYMTIKTHIPGELEFEESRGYKWLLNELSYGDVGRSIAMPSPINAGKVGAIVKNGVLILAILKAEKAKPKKIAVKQIMNRKSVPPEPGGN